MTLPKFMPTAMPFLTASDFSRPKALDPNVTTPHPSNRKKKVKAKKKKVAKKIVRRAPREKNTYTLGTWITFLSNTMRQTGYLTTIKARQAMGAALTEECLAMGLAESTHPMCGLKNSSRFEHEFSNTMEQLAEAWNRAVEKLGIKVEPLSYFRR